MRYSVLLLTSLLLACGSPDDRSAASTPVATDSVELRVEDKASPEGNAGDADSLVFLLQLNRAASAPVTVSWETADETAFAGEDYEAAAGQLVLAPGEMQAELPITLTGDDIEESAESFLLRLTAVEGAEQAVAQARGTIANDDSACTPPLITEPNVWREDDRQLLNFSHRGGALEYPENTLYSYKKSVEIGADVIEMDVYETADGQLVVIHDATVDRTTESSGDVNSYTVEQLKAMDAAYWFVDQRGSVTDAEEAEYLFRGVATGAVEPPAGYSANDFTIPTLEEILQAFPDTLINIELKPDLQNQGSYESKLAALLQAYGRTNDVIVASFIDTPATLFKLQAPCVSTSYPTGQAALNVALSQGPSMMIDVGLHDAFQVPPSLGVEVVTEDFVNDAHAAGLAVHVWTINSCDEMVRLLNLGVDAVMTDRPGLLEQVLAQAPGSWSCDGL
jgi:glycerophosphoryl diester phosphodiesterase